MSEYNLRELKGLQAEIEKEIKARQQQEVIKAREQILAIAQGLGITLEELLANSGKIERQWQRGASAVPEPS